ncbi:hypothetical protein OLMES_0122 [Oleiphilus messinensis]|uniref:Uncharacterized protein n=2 Tax=Oleiphilus messinensis TaxID=141451 RepID=A0A1Y0I1U3_9GAMM|nr:hypothetical protein OLMES_0122 [Oleiphilus messinensis]
MILRDHDKIKKLSAVPETVFKSDEIGSGDFDCAVAALYKGIYDPNANLAQLLVTATELFNPRDFTPERFEFLSRIQWPQLAIIRTIYTHNAENEFNQHIEKALKLHKEYWINISTRREIRAEEGVISLPLTALAVLAHDVKGYRVTVENDYIADWLIKPKTTPTTFPSNEAQPLQDTQAKHNQNEMLFPNTPPAISDAIFNENYSLLESLREYDYSEYIPDMIDAYEITDDWKTRNSIIYVLADRIGDARLHPVMESALHGSDHLAKALALSWLRGSRSYMREYSVNYGSGLDEPKIDLAVREYLATQR